MRMVDIGVSFQDNGRNKENPHMNYELCKQLKKAGYSQNIPEDRDMWHFCNEDITKKEEDWELFYSPTLSELIEACGKNFDSLERHGCIHCEDEKKCKLKWDAIDWRLIFVSGETPEEAVANLWLNLKGKYKWKK